MALVLYDRVQQTGTANTTVSFTLSGSVTGYQSFSVVGNGNTTYYGATDTSGNWEVGLGTYSTTGPTLTRTTILSSSNSGSAVTFSGTVTVFVTYPSSTSVYEDTSGNVSPLGTITSGVWNGSTIPVAYGGTGVTSSSGANSVMLRDANQNVAVNRLNQSNTNVTAAAGTTALTAASSYSQTLNGTGGQTYTMPDATTLTTGVAFVFNNNATGTLTLQDYASGAIGTITSGGAVELVLLANGTVAGTWDVHGYLPEAVTWGTNALALGSTVITGGTWNGGTIPTGYGGTGLTTFTAANNALYSTSASALAAGTLPVAAGGTGATTLTQNGVVYGNGTSAAGITAAGTTGQVLIATTSGAPSWGAVPTTAAVTSFQTSLSGLTPSSATTGVVTLAGTLGVSSGGTGATTLTGYVKGSGTSALTAASTIPTSDLTGTLGIGNGGTGQTTAGAAFNALSPITTTGDLIIGNGTNSATRLGIGTNGYILQSNGTTASWAANAGSTTLTTTDFTATSGQTTFSVTYTPALLQGVYRNGIKLGQADYTATNGTSVVLATGAITGDLIQVQYFSSLSTTTAVNTISFGSTGLTPSTATAGAVTVAGTLAVANGGTGLTSFTAGQIHYGSFSTSSNLTYNGTTLTVGSGPVVATGGRSTFSAASEPYAVAAKYVSTGGAVYFGAVDGTATPDSQISNAGGSSVATFKNSRVVQFNGYGAGALSTDASGNIATGTLAVGNGGTGATTFTANGVLYGNGTSAVGVTAAGTTGQVLTANTGAAPTWGAAPGATITGTTTSATYYVVGTTSTSGSLSTASISNTNVVSYNASTGALTAVSHVSSSDERLKSNIQTLTNAVQTVEALRGVSYLRNDIPEIGVVAQEVEKVLPMLVQEDPEGYKSVAYGNMVGLLIEAVKELSAEVKALKAELNK